MIDGAKLDGSWTVEAVTIGGELVPLVEGSQITVEFDGDKVHGRAINRFHGSYGESGFGPMASTMMAGPQELMNQEHAFLSVLSQVDGVSVERVGLTVDGRIVTVLVRSGTEEE